MLPRLLPLLLLPGLALVDVDYFWQVGFDQKSSILSWPHTLRIFVIFVITPYTNLDIKVLKYLEWVFECSKKHSGKKTSSKKTLNKLNPLF